MAFLIFFAIWYVISIDELKTDYKNPIETCNNLNPLVLPEYFVHAVPTVLFIFAGEWTSFFICGLPLIVYHAWRYSKRPSGMSVTVQYDLRTHFVLMRFQGIMKLFNQVMSVRLCF